MRFSVAAIVVLCATACSESPTQATRGVSVTGRVLAITSNTGVPGVTVAFDPSEGTFNGAILVPTPGSPQTITDANGSYTLALATTGKFWTWVNSDFVGELVVTSSAYRGDLLVGDGTTCVARYGMITDARTQKAVGGAAITVGPGLSTVSAADGWYRIDFGCPANGLFGFNTTVISVNHPAYADFSQILGRGVGGLRRLDLRLERR